MTTATVRRTLTGGVSRADEAVPDHHGGRLRRAHPVLRRHAVPAVRRHRRLRQAGARPLQRHPHPRPAADARGPGAAEPVRLPARRRAVGGLHRGDPAPRRAGQPGQGPADPPARGRDIARIRRRTGGRDPPVPRRRQARDRPQSGHLSVGRLHGGLHARRRVRPVLDAAQRLAPVGRRRPPGDVLQAGLRQIWRQGRLRAAVRIQERGQSLPLRRLHPRPPRGGARLDDVHLRHRTGRRRRRSQTGARAAEEHAGSRALLRRGRRSPAA